LEAIDKTDPREVLDYRIMLFLGFSLLVIVPVSIFTLEKGNDVKDTKWCRHDNK
jgi:hypothetical protein